MSTTRRIALIVALTLGCLASGPAALGNPFDFVKVGRAFNKWLEEDPVARREYQDVERKNQFAGEEVGGIVQGWCDPRETTVDRMIKKSPSRVPPRVLKYYRPDMAKRMPPDGRFQIAARVIRANYYQPKAPPTVRTAAAAAAAAAATPAPRQGLLRSFIGKLRGK